MSNLTALLQDPKSLWSLRVFGRQSAMKQATVMSKDPTFAKIKDVLLASVEIEKKLVKAAKAEDQVAWDAAMALSKANGEAMKLAFAK